MNRGKVSTDLSRRLEKRTGRIVAWIPSRHFGDRCGSIDTLVLHYTATGSLEETIALFRREENGPSAHYVIAKDGRIVQMVDIEKKAWHAGESIYQDRNDVNDFSVGIELVNWGTLRERDGRFYVWPKDYGTAYHGETPIPIGGTWWEPFTEGQYQSLIALVREIRACYPRITGDSIVGHESIALPKGRKIDPGPAFDWERVRTA